MSKRVPAGEKFVPYEPGTRRGSRRPWRTNEIAELAMMWNRGDSLKDMATYFDRHGGCIYNRVRKMGLPRRIGPDWTRAQDRIIEESVDALLAHLCARFNRGPGAVNRRIVRALCGEPRRRRNRKKADLADVA